MRNAAFLFICALTLTDLTFGGVSIQLQTESEALVCDGFVMAVEPKVKYSGNIGDNSFHAGLEWEVPVVPESKYGELELETEFKFKGEVLSLGIQNEFYVLLREGLLSDEITLEPYIKVFDLLDAGADFEFDILDDNKGIFSFEIEPTLKFAFPETKFGEFGFEMEAPVLQIVKKGQVPSSVVESTDLWLLYTKGFNQSLSVELLSGGGYNFIKECAQYRVESAIKFGF
ncbi:MAG: hypothetical protein ACOCSE_01240 [Chitinivibrionales bacterium]